MTAIAIAIEIETPETPEAEPHYTGLMSELNETGDTKVMWDADKPAEVEAARATFNALLAKGYLAFDVTGKGGQGERMKDFRPAAERVILVPQMVGG